VYYNGQMNTDEALRRLTEVVRCKYLTLATERTYWASLRRYCNLPKGLPLHLPCEHKLERFLTVLAQNDVAASTASQACEPAERKNCLPLGLFIHDPLGKTSERPINFGRRSSQNSTLQNSLAVKSSDHS
jgi:hypothetical protein